MEAFIDTFILDWMLPKQLTGVPASYNRENNESVWSSGVFLQIVGNNMKESCVYLPEFKQHHA